MVRLKNLTRSRVLGLVGVLLLLALGIAIIYWKSICFSYVQVPGDILFLDPVLSEVAPSSFDGPQNGLLSDHIYQFYVWHTLAGRQMQSGRGIPLWNPYFFSGQPLLANAQSALFYPSNLLLFFLNAGEVATLRGAINILVAGLFTYLLCRELDISWTGSTLSAVAFAFSGATTVGPSHAYANVLVWLPFMLWGAERIFRSEHPLLWGLMTGIGVGLSILGGHPETTVHNVMVLTLYFGARLLFAERLWQQRPRRLAAFALAIFCGLLIGAVQWIPFAEFLSQAGEMTRNRSWREASKFYTAEWLPNLASTITLLYPNFFGNPADTTYLWPFSNYQNYLEQSMHFGLLSLALAVAAPFAHRRRRSVTTFALLALLCLLIALRFPVFEAVNHLPILNRINNTRLKWMFSLLGAVLSGFGLDALVQSAQADKSRDRRVIWAFGSVLVAGLAILGLVGVLKYVLVPTGLVSPDAGLDNTLYAVFSLRQARTMASVCTVFAGVGIYLLLRFGRPILQSRAGMLVLGVTFVELLVITYGYNAIMPQEMIAPPVELTQTLAEDPTTFRVLSADRAFWPNYGALYGFAHVGGYDLPVHRRQAELYRAQGGRGATYLQLWSPDWPLVNWMNVKYIVSMRELDDPGLEPVLRTDTYFLYRNPDVLPRAYMVYETEIVEREAEAIDRLTNGIFNFQQRVLLEHPLPSLEAQAIETDHRREKESSVEIVSYDHDELEIEVSTESAGLLVMSELYTPGWQAQVDGRRIQLHRANFAFRAVYVPEGEHRVTLSYHPLSFRVGSILSLLGLMTFGVGVVIHLRSASRHSRGT